MSGFILPKSGDKTVAGEAFGKLTSSQKKVVADNVNKKTKKVLFSLHIHHTTITTTSVQNTFKVARESVKEQVFDVGHLAAVKERLKALLTSELTPVSEMSHDSAPSHRSVEDEGN